MTENTDQSDVPRLADAELVAGRVQITNVLLSKGGMSRQAQVSLSGEGMQLQHGVEDIDFTFDRETSTLVVQPTFTLKSIKLDEPEPEPQIFVTATFVLIYVVNSFDGIDESHLKSFAAINGVFNAWPYWREFVQGATMRMNVPQVITPIYRVDSSIQPQA